MLPTQPRFLLSSLCLLNKQKTFLLNKKGERQILVSPPPPLFLSAYDLLGTDSDSDYLGQGVDVWWSKGKGNWESDINRKDVNQYSFIFDR